MSRLTERELEVLALLAEGRSNTGIAQLLVVSPRTVENHVANIFRALTLDDTETGNRRVQATLAYLLNGTTPPGTAAKQARHRRRSED
jgi:DNA-binding NarL/FixJ family response regulator